MRLHRFYVREMINAQVELSIHSAELTNQIRKVFRLKNGDFVILFDGSGFDYECKISGSAKESIDFSVVSSQHSRYMPSRDIYLCAAITKKDTFEWIVEKATELGVTHIVPVLAERSEKKSLNEERLRKIAIEASEQSGRGGVPQILPITKLDEVTGLTAALENTKSIVFHTEGEMLNKKDVVASDGISGEAQPLYVFIGPEGGWSQAEMDMFHRLDMPVACLGNQVLRAETAVIVALSAVTFPNIWVS